MLDVRSQAQWDEQLKAAKPDELLVVEWVSPTCKVRGETGARTPQHAHVHVAALSSWRAGPLGTARRVTADSCWSCFTALRSPACGPRPPPVAAA